MFILAFLTVFYRYLKDSLTIINVMSTVMVYAYGKLTVVLCLMLSLALVKFHPLLLHGLVFEP